MSANSQRKSMRNGLFREYLGQVEYRGRALIVEDDPEIATLLGLHLEALGYRSRVAVDVHEARAHLEGPTAFDVVVVDIVLPGENGLWLASRMRRNPATATVPLLFVSGAFDRANLGLLERRFPPARSLGKPFSIAAIRTAIRELTEGLYAPERAPA